MRTATRLRTAALLAAALVLLPAAAAGAGGPDPDPDAIDAATTDAGGADTDATDEAHLDTSTPRTAETVEAELATDGDIERAWVRRHERDEAGGPVDERLEEIEAARIPVAVRIRYELDGEQVTGERLQGATGEAAIRIQLRNPTAEPRPVTRPDGEEVEVDLSLPILAEGLLELDDTWRDVRTDAGRLAPAPDGATRLRWSSALFEPLADATAELEVRGEVDGANLPRLEVEAAAVTSATNDLLRVLERRATDAGTTDAVAAFIADGLGEGLGGAAEGAEGLADGLEQAREGAGEITAALAGMQDGLGDLDELGQGLARLDEGLAGIAEGLARVEDGLDEVAGGITALGDGVGEAREGAQRLRDDIAAPAEDAVREAWQVLGERFTVGRLDPAYADALMAVGELHALLTGEVPATDDLDEPPGDGAQQQELAGLLAEISRITGEEPASPDEDAVGDPRAEGLEDYPGLVASLDGLAGGLGEAAEGAHGLAAAAEGIAGGLAELREGVQEMRAMLAEAAPDAGGPEAPGEMGGGLADFETALARLADGGGELAGGIRSLGEGGEELVDRLERDLEAANLDLATIDALADRAAEPVDGNGDAVGGHDRYLLVLHEPSRGSAPVVALAGLALLAGALELLRRRLTAV